MRDYSGRDLDALARRIMADRRRDLIQAALIFIAILASGIVW